MSSACRKSFGSLTIFTKFRLRVWPITTNSVLHFKPPLNLLNDFYIAQYVEKERLLRVREISATRRCFSDLLLKPVSCCSGFENDICTWQLLHELSRSSACDCHKFDSLLN